MPKNNPAFFLPTTEKKLPTTDIVIVKGGGEKKGKWDNKFTP